MRNIARALAFLAVCTATSAFSPSAAAEPDAAEKGAAAAGKDEITRFLGPGSAVVVRVDMGKVDVEAFEAWATRLLQDTGLTDAEVEEWKREVRGPATQVKNWQLGFEKAGGRRLY